MSSSIRRHGRSGPSRWWHIERQVTALRPHFFSFSIVEAAHDASFSQHCHTQHELLLIESGSYRCMLNGELLCLPGGTALIVQPGDVHEDRLRNGVRYYGLLFSLVREPLSIDTQMSVFVRGIRSRDHYARVSFPPLCPYLKTLRAESPSGDHIASSLCETSALSLFWHVIRQFPRQYIAEEIISTPENENFRVRMNDLFDRSLPHPLRVAAMAGEFNMSASYFTHRCRALFGMSPAAAFMRFKMQRALPLLETGIPVADISSRLGFKSPYHFSRMFKKAYGKPPSSMGKGQSGKSRIKKL